MFTPTRRVRAHRSVAVAALAAALVVPMTATAGNATAAASAAAAETSSTSPNAETGISPQMQDAAQEAVASGTEVEVPELTTETSIVHALPEGGFELRSTREPVRTKQDGQWVPVNDALTRNADGTFSPAAATVELTFSGGGAGPLLTMGTSDGTVSLTWPTPLPEPAVSGDTATYPEVLPGVDLNLIAAPGGYKQLITVKNADAAANPALDELTLKAHADGVKLATDARGAITVTNDDGQQVMAGPRPYQWDDHSPGPEEATDETTGAADVALVDVSSGTADGTTTPASTSLTIAPDTTALRAPDTVYPVRIDPSLNKIDAHYLTVQNTGWDYYDDTSEPMRVGHCWNGYGQCTNNDQLARSYFSFDVTALTGQATTAKVFSASVIASQIHNASCSATPVTLWSAGAFTSTTNWGGPNSVALQTKSSSGGACGSGDPADVVFSDTEGGAISTRFQNAANSDIRTLYFGLISPDESNSNYWKKFGINPEISVVYDFPPSAPTGLDIYPKVACNGVAVTTDTTPTFYAEANNNNPGYATVDLVFEIHKNPSTGVLVSSGQLNVAENTVTPWTTPTALGEGKYALRVQSQTASPYNVDLTAWSSWFYFNVDTSTVTDPTITSYDYPEGQWGAPANRNGTFNLASTSTDVVGFVYNFDSAAPPAVPNDTCTYNSTSGMSGFVHAVSGKATFTPGAALAVGYHTLTVRAFDGAHRASAGVDTYVFYVAQNITSTVTGNPYRHEAETIATAAPSGLTQPYGQGTPTYNGGNGLPWYTEGSANAAGLALSNGYDVHMVVPDATARPSFTYDFTVPATGYYALNLKMHAYAHFATAEVDVDGQPVLKPDGSKLQIDTYSATRKTIDVPLGGRQLKTDATHRVTIRAVGANSAAVKYTFNGTYGTGTTATISSLPAYSLGLDNITAALISAPEFTSLQAAFNNNGISPAGTAGDIDLTTANLSLDAAKLPSTITVGGVQFARPAEGPNGVDNVIAAGQKIAITPQNVQAVHLLVASTCKDTPITPTNRFTLNYAGDPMPDPANLPMPRIANWTSTSTDPANSLAITGGAKTGTITNTSTPVLYKITATQTNSDMANDGIVDAVTLPTTGATLQPKSPCTYPQLHIFAMTIQAPQP